MSKPLLVLEAKFYCCDRPLIEFDGRDSRAHWDGGTIQCEVCKRIYTAHVAADLRVDMEGENR